jgi:hypothetical protein
VEVVDCDFSVVALAQESWKGAQIAGG